MSDLNTLKIDTDHPTPSGGGVKFIVHSSSLITAFGCTNQSSLATDGDVVLQEDGMVQKLSA